MTYKKGKEKIWKWTFYWNDDRSRGQGAIALRGTYLGTRSDFDKWCDDAADRYGQVVWGIKIHDMTEEDYQDYLFWHAE